MVSTSNKTNKKADGNPSAYSHKVPIGKWNINRFASAYGEADRCLLYYLVILAQVYPFVNRYLSGIFNIFDGFPSILDHVHIPSPEGKVAEQSEVG